MWRAVIRTLDSFSAFVGSLIWLPRKGGWYPYTDGADESISEASARHHDDGRWSWPMRWIDLVLSPVKRDHCIKARRRSIEASIRKLQTQGYTVLDSHGREVQ